MHENVSARLNGLRANAETAFRVGDLDLPERRKRYTSNREEEEIEAQMCPCGKQTNRVELTYYGGPWSIRPNIVVQMVEYIYFYVYHRSY